MGVHVYLCIHIDEREGVAYVRNDMSTEPIPHAHAFSLNRHAGTFARDTDIEYAPPPSPSPPSPYAANAPMRDPDDHDRYIEAVAQLPLAPRAPSRVPVEAGASPAVHDDIESDIALEWQLQSPVHVALWHARVRLDAVQPRHAHVSIDRTVE